MYEKSIYKMLVILYVLAALTCIISIFKDSNVWAFICLMWIFVAFLNLNSVYKLEKEKFEIKKDLDNLKFLNYVNHDKITELQNNINHDK